MRRRRLAAELRRLRREASLSVTQAAERVGWPGSKISRIETRKIGVSASDVRKLLTLYGISDPDYVQHLMDLARKAKERGWWESYASALPTETRTMIGIETEASLVRTYHQGLVPGLLQTPDYARAVIRVARPNDAPEIIESLLEVRLARQRILEGEGAPKFWAVIGEGAIRQAVGGPGVMAAQLRHLTLERDRLNVVVQVLPFSAGEHPAMVGSFAVYDFPSQEETGAVYVETLNSALIMESQADLDGYVDAFERVAAAALSPKESAGLIRSVADG